MMRAVYNIMWQEDHHLYRSGDLFECCNLKGCVGHVAKVGKTQKVYLQF